MEWILLARAEAEVLTIQARLDEARENLGVRFSQRSKKLSISGGFSAERAGLCRTVPAPAGARFSVRNILLR
jgi:hypothetical protein